MTDRRTLPNSVSNSHSIFLLVIWFQKKGVVGIKRLWFHPADNTVLNCPSVNYKFNRDTYVAEKKLFWSISILGFIASILIIVFCNDTVVQTIAGSFLGGILSLIVWLFSIRQQDKMNYEIAIIDFHIALIDEHLEFIHKKIEFIDPDEYGIVEAESKNLIYRFLHLCQFTIFLSSDENIDTSELMLKYSDDKEYTLKEYTILCDKLAENHFAELLILQNKWDKVINWNYYTIDRHLNELRKKLCRYKSYIYCGNVPQDYNNVR